MIFSAYNRHPMSDVKTEMNKKCWSHHVSVSDLTNQAKQRYGTPRLTDELRSQGLTSGRQPASSGAAGESLAPIQPGQLP